ncbi:TonB-dependent receptor [Halieaceae bacterium IMCC14734]|uniref:TonB-dependent receptor n=1 Tax=Candidatus Litorirhabdus singularis TaxID=2518993 RepID=A0ABT3TL66_9GAMM|nr:TonB-dependent receptor [Candidatus Litorirhabdus singularis]MCX2983001.1 TonB-dependent receptor [Candidatus Litorirhabdus singularis]
MGKNGVPASIFTRNGVAGAISLALTTTGYSDDSLMLEEILVTASKRETSLQDLPQAVTAFTTADIKRQGMLNMDDYVLKIPSLSMARREPGGTSLSFRGVAASGIQFNASPSAGMYLDEQPITSAGFNPDPRLIDIERVEALSGPQGTLFGEASQSGTLRIITNKPDTDEFSGWVEAETASVQDSDDYDAGVSAMVNMPLLEGKLALRLVGFTGKQAGYIDNVLGVSQEDSYGRPGQFTNAEFVEDDVNAATTSGGRAALRWNISDDWTLDAGAMFQKMELDGYGDTSPDAGVGDREQLRFKDESSTDDWYQLSLTLEGSTSWADIVLNGSYFEREFEYAADATDYLHDFDQKYDPNYYTIYDFGGHPRAERLNADDGKRWTLEGRLATPSDSSSRWHGLVGFYYGKSERTTKFTSNVQDFADTPAFAYLNYYQADTDPSLNGLQAGAWTGSETDGWYGNIYESDIEQKAVFGEVTFDITERFAVTAGGRWYDIERTWGSLQTGIVEGAWSSFADDYVLIDDTVDSSESDFVPKLNTTFRITDENLIYATYSEGFRAGGGNAVRSASVLPRQYDGDTVKNFEIGTKNTLLDGALNLNLVIYHMQWDDIQIQVTDPTIFALGFVNFPEAVIDGFEAEFAWMIAPGLTFSGSYTHTKAEISEDATIINEGELVAEVFKGQQLPITPENKAALALDYSFQSSFMGMEPYVRADYVYIGDSVNSLGIESIVFPVPPTEQSAYSLVNLRGGLSSDSWNFTLYVDNVTDEVAEQFYSNAYGSQQRLTINRPRTVGLNVRFSF